MFQSLSAQVSYYSDYIQQRDAWQYAGVYADEAYTGTKASRPEFQRLLEDCKAGKIDMIITKSVSRFARNTLTLLSVIRELTDLGVGVFFEKEKIWSNSKDGELLLTILASYAQEESRSCSENCKWRIRERFEKGEPYGLVSLYGYKSEFDAGKLKAKVAEIRVPAANQLTFIFKNGREISLALQSSRRDSWSDEMRQQARADAIRGRSMKGGVAQ